MTEQDLVLCWEAKEHLMALMIIHTDVEMMGLTIVGNFTVKMGSNMM